MANKSVIQKYCLHLLQIPALFLTCTVSSMYERIHKCFQDRKDYIHRQINKEKHWCLNIIAGLNRSIKQPDLKKTPSSAHTGNLQRKTTNKTSRLRLN